MSWGWRTGEVCLADNELPWQIVCTVRVRAGNKIGKSRTTPDNMDDPLELKGLLVSFDYLMYKIRDRIAGLIEDTERAVVLKQQSIEEDYLGSQLKVFETMDEIAGLEKRCDELEGEFVKLDQLYEFVADFRARLAAVEAGFARV